MVYSKHPYVCYAIVSADRIHTYIGITNCIERRLRQHNGELAGGARYTRKFHPWTLVACIRGFQNHQQAASFEWDTKHGRGVQIRTRDACQRVLERLSVAVASQRWRQKCVCSSLVLECCYSEHTVRSPVLDDRIEEQGCPNPQEVSGVDDVIADQLLKAQSGEARAEVSLKNNIQTDSSSTSAM